MANEPQTQQTRPRDTLLRTVAILGLIAVLLLGAWGIITLAVNLPSIFGAIGSGAGSALAPSSPQQTVTVSVPATAQSGQSLKVTWAHENQNNNSQFSYALSYSCTAHVTMKAPVPTGSYTQVPCNEPFDYVNATQHMTLIPTLQSGSAQVVITVSATDLSTGAVVASGSATTTVEGAYAQASTPASTATTKPASTASSASSGSTASSGGGSYYPAAKKAASLWGYPDLAVSINSVTPSGNREYVTFTIQNVGTNVTRSGWTFNATVPVQGSYTYASHGQQALYPGDKIVYTLGFDRPARNGCNTYNCNPQPYVQPSYRYPTTNNPYTCNNYGPCNIPGYVNLYPYGSPYTYPNYCGTYPCSSNYANSYWGSSIGTVTVTANPYGTLAESNRANNTASAQAY